MFFTRIKLHAFQQSTTKTIFIEKNLKSSFMKLKMNFRFFFEGGGEIVEWTTSQWGTESSPARWIEWNSFNFYFLQSPELLSLIMNFRASHSSINFMCFFSHHHVINCFLRGLSTLRFECSRLHSADWFPVRSKPWL